MFSINPLQLHVIVGALIPLLLALFLKSGWDQSVKAIISVVLNGISAFLLQSVNDQGFATFTTEALTMAIVQIVVAIAAYTGFWHPTVDPNTNIPAIVPTTERMDASLSQKAD